MAPRLIMIGDNEFTPDADGGKAGRGGEGGREEEEGRREGKLEERTEE